jgi:hypothetical protein
MTCAVGCSTVPLTLTHSFLLTYPRAKLNEDRASPSPCLRLCLILNCSITWTFTWASASFVVALANLISLPCIPASQSFYLNQIILPKKNSVITLHEGSNDRHSYENRSILKYCNYGIPNTLKYYLQRVWSEAYGEQSVLWQSNVKEFVPLQHV